MRWRPFQNKLKSSCPVCFLSISYKTYTPTSVFPHPSIDYCWISPLVCACVLLLLYLKHLCINVFEALWKRKIDGDYSFTYNIDFQIFTFHQQLKKRGCLLDKRSLIWQLLEDSLGQLICDSKCNENRSEYSEIFLELEITCRLVYTL